MKKLIFSLLLLAPGLAIKAGEIHEEIPKITIQEPIKEEVLVTNIEQLQAQALSELNIEQLPEHALLELPKETAPEFNVDFLLNNSEQAEIVRDALRKEEERLFEGIQGVAEKLKSYEDEGKEATEELTKLINSVSKTGRVRPKELAQGLAHLLDLMELAPYIVNEYSYFCTTSVRKFSDYPAQQAGYLAFERIARLIDVVSSSFIKDERMKEMIKNDFKKELARHLTDSDLEELVNCIRANEMPNIIKKDRLCFFNMVATMNERKYGQSIDLSELNNKKTNSGAE